MIISQPHSLSCHLFCLLSKMFIASLQILAFLYFFFLHNPSFTFATNFPAPYSCFPVDTNPAQYHCFDNNLASLNPNPVFSLPEASKYSTPNQRKWVFSFARGNTVATIVIFLITLLNVIVYKLRQLQESNSGEKLTVSSSLPSEQLCRRFSLAEILSATHNFDESLVIGQGGFGKVYKGIIDNGENTVAIKRLNSMSKQGASEFLTEISMLSKYRHSHLVSLLGYCDNYHEKILVYEYMVHGTLADHLHEIGGKGGVSNSPLFWVQRLKICIGAARGLDYLHTGTGIQHRVIHRDVKSTNILLDENWAAKISDFGMSKIGPANQACTHVSTLVKGTFGYVDPEYFLTRRLTRKSDVYSFGVVLLEVLCGRPAVDASLHEDQRGLARWAEHCIKEGKVDQIVDSNLTGHIASNCLSAFVQIADQCLNILPKQRPTMAEVVAWLEFALSLQERRDSSILEEDIFNDGGVYDSQENAGSSTSREIINNHKGQPDGTIELGDANVGESPIKPTNFSIANDSQPVIKPIKRMRFTTKVKLLFLHPHQVISDKVRRKRNCCQKPNNDVAITRNPSQEDHGDPKPSTDRKSNNNVGRNNRLPSKDGGVVQLVPPSRRIALPSSVQNAQTSKNNKSNSTSGGNSALPNKDGGVVRQVPPSGQIVNQSLKVFSFAELKIATRNFRPDTLLGEGGFGRVFKGWVDEKTYATSKFGVGMPVAIKKLDPESMQGVVEWQAEVTLLGRYTHPNLVKLLGYCWEDKVLVIVYEYMEKGSLENYLFRKGAEPLAWAIRLKIAVGAAQGLAFLHEAEKQVIYRDFKTSNILLDVDFNAKLSDFGLARLGPIGGETHITTRVMGTYGYAAPEYVATGHLYVKSDVYGFGVVLLEMLTGLRALDVNRDTGKHNLVGWAKPLLRNKRKLISSLVDPRLEQNYPPKGVVQLAALALQCLKQEHQTRPSMAEVVETLERIPIMKR